MKAEAVIFTAPRTVTYDEVRCPDPGPGDVVVRITHSWISNGTEGSYLRGERIDGDTPYREGDPWPFPVVAGYQKVGVVESVGADVSDLRAGETVFATIGHVDGMHHTYGGHVSPSVCPREEVWKLPEGIDPLAFSGLVLAQVGYNSGMRAPIEPGGGAVVVGDGLVGQWTAQTLAWRGACVSLIGHHEDRLARFAAWPHAQVINARKCDWTQVVQQRFPGGAHVGVDTVGSLAVMENLTSVMRRYGHLVSAGFYGTQDRLALQPPRYKELSINLVSGWVRDRIDATLEMVAAGHLQTLPLITHHVPAQRAEEAWRLIESEREHVLGVILDW